MLSAGFEEKVAVPRRPKGVPLSYGSYLKVDELQATPSHSRDPTIAQELAKKLYGQFPADLFALD